MRVRAALGERREGWQGASGEPDEAELKQMGKKLLGVNRRKK
jgi:hypothetical protein